LNKKNTIDDYIAAAEWLIANGYTSPDRLVANGGSASAFISAIAVMRRPDLFGAALIDIPFLDLLRYDQYTGGGQFASECGSITNAAEFNFLRNISPYHNIEKNKCYPPMLIRVGELDQTAVPMHGYKFVAGMQANQTCKNPVLLKVMRGAGHNFGATPEQNVESSVDGLSFLFRALDMEPPATNVCSSKAEHRDFDFWLGEWDVFSGDKKESSIQPIIGRCVIYENYQQKDGYSGKSFNFYDRHLHQWRQTWVDVSGMASEFAGSFQEGGIRYEGESHYPDGKKALRRMTLLPLTQNRVRQSSEISRDNGKTWEPLYDLLYVRKQ
jgi:hypothetical protein